MNITDVIDPLTVNSLTKIKKQWQTCRGYICRLCMCVCVLYSKKRTSRQEDYTNGKYWLKKCDLHERKRYMDNLYVCRHCTKNVKQKKKKKKKKKVGLYVKQY